ncbi:dipeptide ABC transporter ATP-binding protein [Microbacterium aquimaris]
MTTRADHPDLLEVDGLAVRYGDSARRAVNDVTFAVRAGERVAIVGESGSGKTTLALALAGFLVDPSADISARSIRFDGHTLTRRVSVGVPRKTSGLTMVFQDAMTSLDPVWTIGSQFHAVMRNAPSRVPKNERRTRIDYWLDRVGLRDHDRVLGAKPYELSGGMRQRAMLALALCGRPRMLIADEPTSALDASLARDVMDLMVELTEESRTALLIVTHDIELCQQYADRVLVMLEGNMVDDIPVNELGYGNRHPYTEGLLRCTPTLGSANLDFLPTIAAAERATW